MECFSKDVSFTVMLWDSLDAKLSPVDIDGDLLPHLKPESSKTSCNKLSNHTYRVCSQYLFLVC